jgi:2-methylisocitrate lyase-like PEP mutase family enzyme
VSQKIQIHANRISWREKISSDNSASTVLYGPCSLPYPGYRDGEAIPVGLVEQIVARIAGTIEVPVTVDFEGGYSDDDQVLAANVSRLLALGVVGMNFEDRVVQGVGLYAVDRQAHRIAAMRDAAAKQGVNLFINARTDVFLGQQGDPAQSVGEALDRAKAYASAGASGFFIPGLQDEALIGRICDGTAFPILTKQRSASLHARGSAAGVAACTYPKRADHSLISQRMKDRLLYRFGFIVSFFAYPMRFSASQVAITLDYRYQPRGRAPIDAGVVVADNGKIGDYRY